MKKVEGILKWPQTPQPVQPRIVEPQPSKRKRRSRSPKKPDPEPVAPPSKSVCSSKKRSVDKLVKNNIRSKSKLQKYKSELELKQKYQKLVIGQKLT